MRWGGLAVLGAAAVLCGWGAYRLWEQRLPPLLSNVRAEGGWWGACPDRPAKDQALSPELNEHLQRQFPPGTPEERLISALAEQRFEPPAPCWDDKTIRSARFYQQGGLLAYDTRAEIFWKVDQANNLVWTKGFVFYVGL
jgi:hypothetical protein